MTERAQAVFLIERMQPDWLDTRREQRAYLVGSILTAGLVFGLVFGLISDLASGLFSIDALNMFWRLVLGLSDWRFFVLVSGVASFLLVAKSKGKIRTVEVLSWSLQRGLKGSLGGMVGGLVIGLFSERLRSQSFGQPYNWDLGLIYAVAWGLLGALALGLLIGLESKGVAKTTTPYQGIKQTAEFALSVGLLGGLFLALIMGLVWEPFLALVIKLRYGEPVRLAVSLNSFTPFTTLFGPLLGLLFALIDGGCTAIQHIVLRAFLTLSGHTPWRYAHFLDYAAERILLRKVGGGYIFVHRLLQEYFASLKTERTVHK